MVHPLVVRTLIRTAGKYGLTRAAEHAAQRERFKELAGSVGGEFPDLEDVPTSGTVIPRGSVNSLEDFPL